MHALLWMMLAPALAAPPTSGERSPAEKAATPLCEAGDLDACFRLAAVFREGRELTPVDLGRAHELLEAGCSAKHTPSCNDLGAMYGVGEGVPKSEAKAASYYTIACDLGDGLSCGNLARFHDAGKGVATDVTKAETLFSRACDLGDASACSDLGIRYGQQLPGYPAKPQEAIRLLTRACEELKGGLACMNLSLFHARGIGVTADMDLGFTYMNKACALGHPKACSLVK